MLEQEDQRNQTRANTELGAQVDGFRGGVRQQDGKSTAREEDGPEVCHARIVLVLLTAVWVAVLSSSLKPA